MSNNDQLILLFLICLGLASWVRYLLFRLEEEKQTSAWLRKEWEGCLQAEMETHEFFMGNLEAAQQELDDVYKLFSEERKLNRELLTELHKINEEYSALINPPAYNGPPANAVGPAYEDEDILF